MKEERRLTLHVEEGPVGDLSVMMLIMVLISPEWCLEHESA